MVTAAESKHLHPAWSMNALSPELLALIFRQLRDIDRRSLAAARRLSKRFCDIITPIQYEFLRLTERIIASQAQTEFPQALENVYTLTRHVEVRNDLDPRGIRRVLDRIERLSSIRWVNVRAELRSGGLWMPADVINPRHMQMNRTRLYIENLPLRDFESELPGAYLKAIPTDMLVSLKIANPAPPLFNTLHALKQLVVAAKRLKVFHYQDRGQGSRFSFENDERMPALTRLVLRSYDWNHSAAQVKRHWDFSRICHLELIDVPIFEFLASVSFKDFRSLHTLHCEDFSAHLQDRREEATRGLASLVHNIHALDTLNITCHTHNFDIKAIIAHAGSLRYLRFRDHVGFSDNERRCPTMWVGHLDMLSQALVHLRYLEIDMDETQCDPPLFLRTLCQFPRLHTLTLHVQTVVRALEVVPPSIDRDRDAAMKTFKGLLTGREGLSRPHWRRIVINVGGWRPHMVRRLGEAWRAQNQRGVFAERCFILERTCDGKLGMREEIALEGQN
ncbi:F-box domain-containing protein [Xylariales sp. PMI_506]|nr:F-box domain-containing protein [Xylariales sp. PMI_506]